MPNEIDFVRGKIVGDCAKMSQHRKVSLFRCRAPSSVGTALYAVWGRSYINN